MRTNYLDQLTYRLAVLAALPVFYLISRYNYNFFHSLADGASIVIAVSVFIIIWNTRHLLENDYLLHIGISFFFFAFLDLIHVLGNKNMGVFPAYGNLGPALYIASRYVISISLLIAPLFVKRKLNTSIVFAVYSSVTAFILLSIFYWHIFPVCFIEGVGLTPFKVISDYIICLILLGAIGLLLVAREAFDSRVFRLIVASIILSIATGVAFTLYADPFGITNAVGHFLQIGSFYLVYLAIIETSLKKPQDILYRKLTQKEKDLSENLKRLDHANAGLKQEIIERNKAEEALRRSEERWAVTLASIGDAVIATDKAGRITFLNHVGEMLTGWPMAEVVGKPVQEVFRIVNEYSRKVVDDPVRKVLSSGLVVGLANHTVLLRKDGGEVPIDDSAAPIMDEAGRMLGVVLIFRDITERRKAEVALRESEAKYRDLFENMTEEVHFWQVIRDENGQIKTWRLVDVNPPTLKTWGRKTIEEIRGKTTDEIFGPGATEHYLPVVQKIVNEGVPHTFEDYFPNLDKYFRFTSVPLGDHFITTGADITDIKKTENAMRRQNDLLEGINRIFETVLTSASDEGFGTTCLEVAEKITGSAISFMGEIGNDGLLHDIAISNPAWQVCAMVDEKGRRRPPGNFNVHGLYGWVLINGSPLLTNEPAAHPDRIGLPPGHPPLTSFLGVPFQQQDKTIGMVAVGNNPNGYGPHEQGDLETLARIIVQALARRRTEEALVQLNDTLEQKVQERTALAEMRAKKLQALAVELIEAEERERRQFAHLLHDDLQQMLAAARIQLQSSPNFANEPLLSQVGRILEDSITKTRRLSHELSPAVLHHSGLVAGLRWLSGQMKEQFGLSVILQAEAAPVIDNFALRLFVFRAVQEVLFNTIKHAGVKQACVTLSGRDHHMVVFVSDQGCGFEIEEFLKGAKKPGFGLLSIIERADYIGGSFEIDSAPGKGSSFTLTVPLSATALYEPTTEVFLPRENGRLKLPSEVISSSTEMRVLFADDHKVMRQGLIKLIIGQPGIQVIGEAASGAEALEQARNLRPDLIIMDISMPGMDGVEATRRIKADLPDVRIIGLTMHDDDLLIGTMQQAGAEVVLSKTISAAEMVKAIYGVRITSND